MSSNVLSCDSTQKFRSIFKFPNRYNIKEVDGYGSKENATYWNGMVGLVSREVIKTCNTVIEFQWNGIRSILLILFQITKKKQRSSF